MPREYSVVFTKVSVSAVQDLVGIYGGSLKMGLVTRLVISDVEATAPTNGQLALRARYLGPTVSTGSGGGSATPHPIDPGDAAATITARINDTTPATSSVTTNDLEENGCNIYAGFDLTFQHPIPVPPTSAVTFGLITTPGATFVMSGTVNFTEIG